MTMSLAQFRERAILASIAKLGEAVVFSPASGAQRTIYGIPAEETAAQKDIATGEEGQEVVWLLVSRDEAAAFGTTSLGGIATAEAGDSIIRTVDSVAVPWSFQQQIRNTDEFSWELKFARNRPTRYRPQAR